MCLSRLPWTKGHSFGVVDERTAVAARAAAEAVVEEAVGLPRARAVLGRIGNVLSDQLVPVDEQDASVDEVALK